MPTYDVENTNCINKGRRLRLIYKLQIVPQGKKGCHKGSRGTGELLYTDHHILNDSKMKQKNLALAWSDYKKAYNKVLQAEL